MKARILRTVAVNEQRQEVEQTFPGCEALRERITAARAAGDESRLQELRVEYRNARMANQGQRSAVRTQVEPVISPSRASVVRTATSARSTQPSDLGLSLDGWLSVWGGAPASTRADGSGSPIWLITQAADVREWLAEVDPASIPLKADHVTGAVGSFRYFELTDYGLWCTAVVDKVFEGLVREAVDGRSVQGFSFGADLSRCRATGNHESGLDVYAGPVSIFEGSLCCEPADVRCTVEYIAGLPPRWQLEQQSIEDDRRLREAGIIR